MKHLLKYFFAGIFLSLGVLAFSQNETAKWYFGDHAGLDFMTSPPTILTNGLSNSIEGTASIADGAGNLLFYTDGATIWNQSHAIMANGGGLLGNGSTSQAALIVKQPGNTNIYFVFTLDEIGLGNGLRYSLVNMNLAAGMGSVTAKNILVQTPSTEKLTGVKHCNGIDTWVVSHDYPSNSFRANLVTAGGLSGSAVISPIGSNINQYMATAGCMKISPNGKKLGLAIYEPPSFELYDFNTSTGVVSNFIRLPVPSPSGKLAFGCEFSPDGTKFYGTNEGIDFNLYQWDLCAGSPAAIIASRNIMPLSAAEQVQLGPDGKIYVARTDEPNPNTGTSFMLGVINNPNAGFAGINYVSTGQSVFPNTCIYGLPNFVSGFYKTPVATFTYTVDPAVSCVTASFSAPPLINNTCSATSYTVDHVAWIFGDPAAGAGNFSPLINPMHTYPGSGIYTAKLILYNACGGVIDTLKQQVMITQVPVTTSGAGFSLCAGQSMTLNASGLSSYLWNTGVTTSTLGITPAANTSYTVEGPGLNGCLLKSVHEVTVNQVPVITVQGSQGACIGSVFTQTASGANSYTWSTGTNGQVLFVIPSAATVYTVTGESNGCFSSTVTSVTFIPAPPLTVTGSNSVCVGSSVVQTASGASTYSWSTGETTSSVTLSPVGSSFFTITVTGTGTNGCTTRTTLTIFTDYLPPVSITGNHTICPGSTLALTAHGASSYTWSNGSNDIMISLSPGTSTSYSVTGTSTTGCSNTANVRVNVAQAPFLTINSATACSGGTVTLAVTSPTAGNLYIWAPMPQSGPRITVSANATRAYTVTVTSASGCTASAQSILTIVQHQNSLAGFSYTPPCAGAGNVSPGLNPGFSAGGNFFNDSLSIDAQTGQVNVTQAAPGNYLVSYSVNLNGCIETVTAPLHILDASLLNISTQVNVAPGASATLHVSGADNYTWTPASYLSCNNCDSPVTSPANDIQYCVLSKKGLCISSACVDVIVTCETNKDFSVPNAFTPNGDHVNDAFCLQGWNDCTSDFSVLIYDRWGEKVFESGDPLFCWDGVYKGRLLESGVFVYVIHAKKIKGNTVDKKGNITLIR